MVARALLVVAAGVVIGVLGIAIRGGATFLIAGYDPDRVTDEARLAAFIGRQAIYVAILTIGVGITDLNGSIVDGEWYWGEDVRGGRPRHRDAHGTWSSSV